MADPAKTPKRTKREIVEQARQACRQEPCYPAAKHPPCPFCPHWRRVLAKKEDQ